MQSHPGVGVPHTGAGHRFQGCVRGLLASGLNGPGLEPCRVEGDRRAVIAGDVYRLTGACSRREFVVQRFRVGVIVERPPVLWFPCDEFDAHDF